MDEPQHEQSSVNVDEVLKSRETYRSLSDLREVMGWQAIGAPTTVAQDFLKLAYHEDPDYTPPNKKDLRWQHVIEGVKTLQNAIGTSTGKITHVYYGEPSLQTVNNRFFDGMSDSYPIQTLEEASRLSSLSPEELVIEIQKIYQRQIAFYVGNKENSDGDPYKEDDANTNHAIWMLRNEGFKTGLRSVGLTIDNNDSVVPGGARMSRDQQSEAVSLLNDHLPVIMKRTYGQENFDNGEGDGYNNA